MLHLIKADPELGLAIEKQLIRVVRNLESRLPILVLSIDGVDSSRALDKNDLQSLFGVFGDIKSLDLLANNWAKIEFEFLVNA